MIENNSLTAGFDPAEIATALGGRPVALLVHGDHDRVLALGPAADVVVVARR